MNPEIILVLVQYRFHCPTWSYFVIVLATYEKTGRLTGKKPNNFSRLASRHSQKLLLNLPKIKNRKTPEGTALGHTGSAGPQRAQALSGWRANVRIEHAQLGGGEGLLVILPTSKEGKSRNKKDSLQLINGSRDLRGAVLPYMATVLPNKVTPTPPGKMRVLLVVALMEANQCEA
jgi:hypothetical protein